VAYAITSDQYVVVFRAVNPAPLSHAIYFDVRKWDLSPVVQNPVASYSTSTLPELPALAYNHTRNELLVVWQQQMPGPPASFDIYGRRLRMAGPGSPAPMDSAFPIAQQGNVESRPAVAAIPSPIGAGQYLVVYRFAVCGHAIKGQRLTGEGNLQGGDIYISDACLTPAQDRNDPAVAADQDTNRYLIVWTHHYPASVGIRGQVISREGTIIGDLTPIGGHKAANASVAAGHAGDYLVAFEDLEAGKRKVFGQLWGIRVYLPLVVRNH
jgi:hypothetical protein